MPEAPTTEITHDGETFTISYEAIIECDRCENAWTTASRSHTPTCPNCGYTTDRNVVGAHYTRYAKFVWAGASQLKKTAIRDAEAVPESEVQYPHKTEEDTMKLHEAPVETDDWLSFTTENLRFEARLIEAMVANGWDISDVSDDGHLVMETWDFSEPDGALQDT